MLDMAGNCFMLGGAVRGTGTEGAGWCGSGILGQRSKAACRQRAGQRLTGPLPDHRWGPRPQIWVTPVGDPGPQRWVTPVGEPGPLINYDTSGNEKVSEVLKGKLGSIQRAPLPRGSPSWSEIGNMTMSEVRAAARANQPGFKAS